MQRMQTVLWNQSPVSINTNKISDVAWYLYPFIFAPLIFAHLRNFITRAPLLLLSITSLKFWYALNFQVFWLFKLVLVYLKVKIFQTAPFILESQSINQSIRLMAYYIQATCSTHILECWIFQKDSYEKYDSRSGPKYKCLLYCLDIPIINQFDLNFDKT